MPNGFIYYLGKNIVEIKVRSILGSRESPSAANISTFRELLGQGWATVDPGAHPARRQLEAMHRASVNGSLLSSVHKR